MTLPHESNFCAGAYPDWLEVNLLEQCNGRCGWCIERGGYHPARVAPWQEIASAALETGAENIILLGGEPTLYKDLKRIVERLASAGRKVWITTNGKRLSKGFVRKNLGQIHGMNISIHHYDLEKNREITGLWLDRATLQEAVDELLDQGTALRLNCNAIAGYVDSEAEMHAYIEFAKSLGIESVRFAELKQSEGEFVNIAKAVGYKYGTSEDPFRNGCGLNAVILRVKVNFRLMCGLQTPLREAPEDPEQMEKETLYYDGVLYDGWQKPIEGDTMTEKEVAELLERVKKGEVSPDDAAKRIAAHTRESEPVSLGCRY